MHVVGSAILTAGGYRMVFLVDRKAHWNRVYATKASDEVSWFQPEPTVSLQLLERSGLTADS